MEHMKMMQLIAQKMESTFQQVSDICKKYIEDSQGGQETDKPETAKSMQSSQELELSLKTEVKDAGTRKKSRSKCMEKKPIKNSNGQTITSAPKKPLSTYNYFIKQKRQSIQNEYPQMEWKVISSIMGKVWRELPDSEKQPYNEDYERRKVEYQQQMQLWERQWLTKKELQDQSQEDQEYVPKDL